MRSILDALKDPFRKKVAPAKAVTKETKARPWLDELNAAYPGVSSMEVMEGAAWRILDLTARVKHLEEYVNNHS